MSSSTLFRKTFFWIPRPSLYMFHPSLHSVLAFCSLNRMSIRWPDFVTESAFISRWLLALTKRDFLWLRASIIFKTSKNLRLEEISPLQSAPATAEIVFRFSVGKKKTQAWRIAHQLPPNSSIFFGFMWWFFPAPHGERGKIHLPHNCLHRAILDKPGRGKPKNNLGRRWSEVCVVARIDSVQFASISASLLYSRSENRKHACLPQLRCSEDSGQGLN